jgi:cell wall-associated NlpC family hydrolase
LLAPSAVLAAPKPTPQELKAQLDRLNDQAETITEQYNGRRVELAEANRSTKRLDAAAARIKERYEQVRQATSAIANSMYMTGGLTSPSLTIGPQDPQAVLSAAALMEQISSQQTTQFQDAARLLDQLNRARARAEEHKEQVAAIVSDVEAKKKHIEKLVKQVEAKLNELGITSTSLANLSKVSIPGRGKAAEAARWAVSQVGKPYVWGAAGPNNYDCSGLMLWSYAKVGISLPHYTGSQWQLGTRISTQAQLQVGDIVFFYSDLHHNGMYIGNGKMVHAPQTGDVVKIVPMTGRPFMGGVRLAS